MKNMLTPLACSYVHHTQGGVIGFSLPNMEYIGISHCEGFGFRAVYSGLGYKNQTVWGCHRASFSRKLINWLKILV